jgi:hypothetical protein
VGDFELKEISHQMPKKPFWWENGIPGHTLDEWPPEH